MKTREPMAPIHFEDVPDPLTSFADVSPTRPVVYSSVRSPTRPELRRRQRLALAFAAAWVLAALAALGVRGDIGAPFVEGNLAAFALVGVVGFAYLLRPRSRGLPAGVPGVRHLLWIHPGGVSSSCGRERSGSARSPPYFWFRAGMS